MNTGVQRSSATPPAARTNTTMPVGESTGARFGQGKNLPLIAMAHEIPYVATATVAELRDLEAKVRRAMEFRGARYIHVLVPCPLGWGHGSAETIKMARLAKETGVVPGVRGRARRGEERIEDPAAVAGRGVPAAANSGSRTCSSRRAMPTSSHGSRRWPIATCSAIGLVDDAERRAVKKAVCDHARPGLEPRQPHGLVAHGAPRLRRPPAALQRRLPVGREHPGLAVPRRIRRLREGVATAHRGRIRCPRAWVASATTRARRRAIARNWTSASASTRSSGSSATRRSSTAGNSSAGRQVHGQARAGRGRRAVGAIRRVPTRALRPHRDDPRGRPARRAA